jgi:hypothetical protein
MGVNIEHPAIVRIMKSIEKERPTIPRYSEFYDIKTLLDHIKKWGPTEELSMDSLTTKVILLLRVTTFARSSDIEYIQYSSIKFQEEGVSFNYVTKKQQRKGSQCLSSFIPKYTDEILCPVRTLQHYINRTQAWRKPIQNENNRFEQDRLMLSLSTPHDPIGSDRISNRISDLFRAAGIDEKRFKPGSLRGASASAALDAGIPVEDVLRLGQWKSFAVFEKFYNRSRKPVSVLSNILSTNQANYVERSGAIHNETNSRRNEENLVIM